MGIEVEGEKAVLFVDNRVQPNLIVKDLKHGLDCRGAIGLFIDNGTEVFFKNLNVEANS